MSAPVWLAAALLAICLYGAFAHGAVAAGDVLGQRRDALVAAAAGWRSIPGDRWRQPSPSAPYWP